MPECTYLVYEEGAGGSSGVLMHLPRLLMLIYLCDWCGLTCGPLAAGSRNLLVADAAPQVLAQPLQLP